MNKFSQCGGYISTTIINLF